MIALLLSQSSSSSVDVRQLHPVTAALLGHLSPSAPPTALLCLKDAGSLNHERFVSTRAAGPDCCSDDVKQLLGPPPRPRGATAASALTMADGAQPAKRCDVTGRQLASAV